MTEKFVKTITLKVTKKADENLSTLREITMQDNGEIIHSALVDYYKKILRVN